MSNERDPLAALPRSNYGIQNKSESNSDAEIGRHDDGDETRAKDPIHRGKAPKNIKSTLGLLALAILAGLYFWSENFQKNQPKKVDSSVLQPAINPEATAANLKAQADADEAKRIAALSQKPPPAKTYESTTSIPTGKTSSELEEATSMEATRLAGEKTKKELILASAMEPEGVEIDRAASQRRGGNDNPSRLSENGSTNIPSSQSQILDYLKSSGSELNSTLRDAANADRSAAAELAARQDANSRSEIDAALKSPADKFYEKYGTSTIKAAALSEPPRPKFSLYQGTIVRVVLETAISSEAPGAFRGRVTSDVLDSVNMNTILIPRGSIVMGVYMTNVAIGQTRLVAATERLILPNGRSINLVGAPPADMQGAAGLPAAINNQYFKMFAGSVLVGAASLLLPKNDQNITINVGSSGTQTGGTLFATAIADILKRVGEREQQLKPIATVDIGNEFTLMFTQDYIMQPYLRSQF